MGYAFIQKAKNTSGTGGSIAQAYGSNVTAGSMLVAFATTDGSSSHTFSSTGDSWATVTVFNDTGAGQFISIGFAPNATGGAKTVTCTFGAAGNFNGLIIGEFSGGATASPLDTNSPGRHNAASTTPTDAAMNTAVDGDLILSVVMLDALGATVSAGSGFTLLDTDSNGMSAEFEVQATHGSIAGAFSLSASVANGILSAALKPAATATASLPAPVLPGAVPRRVLGSSLVLYSQAVSRDAQPGSVVNWAPRLTPQPAGSALILSSVSPSKDAQPNAVVAAAGTRLAVLGSALAVGSVSPPPVPTDTPTAPVLAGGVRRSGPGSALILSSQSPSADSQPAPTLSTATRGLILGSTLAVSSRADPPPLTDTPSRPVTASPLRPTGPGSVLVLSSVSVSLDAQPPALSNAAGIAPVRRGSATVLGSVADPPPPVLPVGVVVPGLLGPARAGATVLSRAPIPLFIAPPGTPMPAVAVGAGRWPTLAPVAVVVQPQRMHSCETPPAFIGVTGRPGSGTTGRPNTGITADPC